MSDSSPPSRSDDGERPPAARSRPNHAAAHAGDAVPAAAAVGARARPPEPLEMAAAHPWDGRDGTLRVAVWTDGRVFDLAGGQALAALGGPREGATTWVDYTDPSPGQVAEVATLLELHPLIVEDIVEGNQRSKIETTEDRIHVVMFTLDYRDDVVSEEVDLVLGPGFLFTVHDASWDPRGVTHLRAGLEPVLRHGPDHLLWALMDAIADGYFPFTDRLGDAVDGLQDEVVEGADRVVLERLFTLKQELIAVRRAVVPVREILNHLTNRDLALIDADEVLYFRDVYDHVIRLTDELDNHRELVAATLDVYLSTVNNDLSRIMKRLTGVTVILAGVGAVAGIFGMSEAGAAFAGAEAAGFWLVTAVTVAAATAALVFLRRIDWI